MRIRFRPEARAEIREARSWYEAQVPGLGRAFLAALDAMIELLRVFPRMYRHASDDAAVRRALMHRFPYSLMYEILSEDDILILACRHVRQDELDWNLERRGG